ncbi:MAG: protoporphyrinogen oxidase [Acidobacteria bacterium]|nr:MAG: protoporphyrinogen oxidase [Acidobacteriota bacterium]
MRPHGDPVRHRRPGRAGRAAPGHRSRPHGIAQHLAHLHPRAGRPRPGAVTSARADVVVVGGGIAGLAAALALHEAGRDFLLLESSPRYGGVIRTETTGGFVVEAGPDSILAQKPEGLQLCRALGLADRLIPTNPETRTIFVLRRGRLHALPEGMMLAVPTRIAPFLRSGLFSWPGKLRMGLDLVLPRGRPTDDESIASLVRRRFGEEAVERLGEPLMAGIHAGDPERLSIRATFPRFVDLEARHRSLIRGMWASRGRAPQAGSAFYSLTGGLASLVDALVARLPAARRRTGAGVTLLEQRGARGRAPDGAAVLRGAGPPRIDPFRVFGHHRAGLPARGRRSSPRRLRPHRAPRGGPPLHRVHFRVHQVCRARAGGARPVARIPRGDA